MNSVLVRARDLIGHPVVTLDGDLVGEVKDVVLGLQSAALVGFTLRDPGFLGGPRDEALPWGSVHSVGADAVMVAPTEATVSRADVATDSAHQAVDLPVITDEGERLGRVVDVVLSTGNPSQVVGFEIESAAGMPTEGRHVLLPIDEMVSASEQALVVPGRARHFVHDDLAGFGGAIEDFRSGGGTRASA